MQKIINIILKKMEVIWIIIWFISVVNFFLFTKSIDKELEIKKYKIYLAYFIIFIIQIFIILFVSFAFINIFFTLILCLLLYFNAVYWVSLQLLKWYENKKDLASIITIRFLKYLVIFEWTIAVIIWIIYISFLLISKL